MNLFQKQKAVIVLLFICYHLIAYSQTTNNTALFTSLPAQQTNINFTNIPFERPGINILTYPYYYAGGGVAAGDINNDGLIDLYFTSNSTNGNKLYLNKGNFKFEDITEKAGVSGDLDWASGVTMVDINGDGYLDIYVSAITSTFNFKGANRLYINNKNNTFTDKAEEYGLNIKAVTVQTAFFDFDKDGDLDCFILSQSLYSNEIVNYVNARDIPNSIFRSRLLRNDSNKGINKFTDVSTSAGIYQSKIGFGLGIAIADINNDGWDDIYIGNDFYEDDYYYVNNGNGTFTESGKKHFRYYTQNSMGNDVADYNNDGLLDVYTVDMLANEEKMLKQFSIEDELNLYNYKYISNGYHHQLVMNCLHTNNDNGNSFTENAILSGVYATDWSWAPLFADMDNDGNKDLLVTAGIPKNMVDVDFIKYRSNYTNEQFLEQSEAMKEKVIEQINDGLSHPYLYKGDGNAFFSDMSKTWGTYDMKGSYSGCAYADLDNDGDLDLVINALYQPAIILKNNCANKNYINISFKTKTLNTSAIGTKVYVYNNGKMQYQQLMPTRGFQSSVAPQLHFGLGTENKIDSIVIVWPNQQVQTLKDVVANKHITITPGKKLNTFNYKSYFPQKQDAYEDISNAVKLNYKHNENDFLDYYVQPFIPHAVSRKGPKITVGDVNADGMDDFFICGASAQAGTLMIQNKDGSFDISNKNLFQADSLSEDVDALFFDADNDNDLDLYVVSGGNQFYENDPALLDRLYINDGKGNFTKSTNRIPALYKDKSCVLSADVDKDGDIDLFVGGFVNTKKYGEAQTSYLLLNDGKGFFSVQKSVFDSLGMVSDAAFTDINNDGYLDLIAVGEWMHVTTFINNKGTFTKSAIPNSSGLWQCVYASDLNNDGNMDLIAGNWGYNTKFWKDKTPPLRLYCGDFDNSGNYTQLLSYVRDGVEYPFYGKEQLERKLPALKKKYLFNKDFAGKPFKEVLGDFTKNTLPLEAMRLGSTVFYGDGKGNFTMEYLPVNLQLAPICAIEKSNDTKRFLAGGNYYDLSPYEGRYDSQPLALFEINNGSINRLAQNNFNSISGQVKELKWINTIKHGKILIVGRNNEPLLFYKPTK
jgi:enediyne biosynthesis protein E4